MLESEMPYCCLLGMDFIKKNGLSVDIGQGMIMKEGECIVRMSNECYENQFVEW